MSGEIDTKDDQENLSVDELIDSAFMSELKEALRKSIEQTKEAWDALAEKTGSSYEEAYAEQCEVLKNILKGTGE